MVVGDPVSASGPLGLFCGRLRRLQAASGSRQAGLLGAGKPEEIAGVGHLEREDREASRLGCHDCDSSCLPGAREGRWPPSAAGPERRGGLAAPVF
jgi:hypothetical protein